MEYLLDAHCHTISSGHAYSTVKEYIDEAQQKGLKLIAITDHAPSLEGSPSEIYFSNLRVIPSFVNGIEVLKGVEMSILDKDGGVDLSVGLQKKLDLCIASLHPPCYPPSTFAEHTQAIICTMDNPCINIIGHLGDPRYPFDIVSVVKKAKQTNTIIEINNASFRPGTFRAGGSEIVKEIIRECIKHEVYMIASSDAHFYTELGDFTHAKDLIEGQGVPLELLLNTSIENFKRVIRAKRGDYDADSI